MRVIDADSLCSTTIITDDYSGNEILEIVLKEDIDEAPTIEAIPIPKDATNGDVIRMMFPNAQIDYHEDNELVEDYVAVYIKGCDICQNYHYPLDWWKSPYKKEV